MNDTFILVFFIIYGFYLHLTKDTLLLKWLTVIWGIAATLASLFELWMLVK